MLKYWSRLSSRSPQPLSDDKDHVDEDDGHGRGDHEDERMFMMGTMRMMMPVTWAVDIWRRSITNWLTTGREDGEMLGKHVINDDVVVNDGDDVDDLSGERVRPDAGERQLEEFRWTVGAEGGERLVLDSKVLRKVLQFMIGTRMVKRIVVFGEKNRNK